MILWASSFAVGNQPYTKVGEPGKKRSGKGRFVWKSEKPSTPSYQGKPEGVVHGKVCGKWLPLCGYFLWGPWIRI